MYLHLLDDLPNVSTAFVDNRERQRCQEAGCLSLEEETGCQKIITNYHNYFSNTTQTTPNNSNTNNTQHKQHYSTNKIQNANLRENFDQQDHRT